MPPSTNKQLQRKNVWQPRNNFLKDLSLLRRAMGHQSGWGGDLKRGENREKDYVADEKGGTEIEPKAFGKGELKLFIHCLRNHQVVGERGMVSALSKHTDAFIWRHEEAKHPSLHPSSTSELIQRHWQLTFAPIRRWREISRAPISYNSPSMCINWCTAAAITLNLGTGWMCLCVLAVFACYSESQYCIYIWLCSCGPLLIYACAPLWACLLLLLCLCCGRAGMEHGHLPWGWIHRNSFGWAWPVQLFRLCIYALDDHSHLYQRALETCLFALLSVDPTPSRTLSFFYLFSAQMFTPLAARSFISLLSELTKHTVFLQQRCNIKLTASIIIHPYFSDEFA